MDKAKRIVTETNFTRKCENLITGSKVTIGIYSCLAGLAGILIVIAGIMNMGIVAMIAAGLLIISIIVFVAQTALLYQLTPARNLGMFQNLEKSYNISRMPDSLNKTELTRAYARKVWGLGRAKEIISLFVVALLYAYFSVCALMFARRATSMIPLAGAVAPEYPQPAQPPPAASNKNYIPIQKQSLQSNYPQNPGSPYPPRQGAPPSGRYYGGPPIGPLTQAPPGYGQTGFPQTPR
jgi:hypothetical protein